MPRSTIPLRSRPRRIWIARCPVPAASTLAWSLGWLAEEFRPDGIEVGWVREGGLRLVDADPEEQARTLFREGGNIQALAARAGGATTRVIGLSWIDERQAIMVRPGAQIFHPADLKGLRIALPGFGRTRGDSIARGMALHGIENALALAGLGPDDVRFVEVPAPPIESNTPAGMRRLWAGLEWLADGRVDAAYVKGGAAAEIAGELGLEIGIDLDAYPSRMTRINNGTPRPIVVEAEMIERHFDIVVRILVQTLRAADWAATNLAAFKPLLARETQAGMKGVDAAYRNGFHRSLHPDLSVERIDMLQVQADFLRRHGFLERPVHLDRWIDPRPLAAAVAQIAASGVKAELIRPQKILLTI